jgi:hypothetical protein
MRSADDSSELQQSSFIDLVAVEKFGVVAKVAKKPVEFPKRSIGAVDFWSIATRCRRDDDRPAAWA